MLKNFNFVLMVYPALPTTKVAFVYIGENIENWTGKNVLECGFTVICKLR